MHPVVRCTPDEVARAIERVRGLRRQTTEWPPLLFRLEWRLYFPLRCAPWRV